MEANNSLYIAKQEQENRFFYSETINNDANEKQPSSGHSQAKTRTKQQQQKQHNENLESSGIILRYDLIEFRSFQMDRITSPENVDKIKTQDVVNNTNEHVRTHSLRS
ncbi:hypothetical protein BLOT_006844 [Blomia tropicalis]|nr:hypothetical protein BLOT_006844 [Blomia tropicalis]